MNSEIPDHVPVDFNGRRVLLIISRFFGYDREIASRLVARGALVTVYEDRPSGSNVTKVLNRIHPSLVAGTTARYLEKILVECRGMVFDDIVVVKGEAFSPLLLKKLFAQFPTARKTFYMWDSFRNARGSRERMASFDRCLTFDPIDAGNTPGLKLRPLFFIPGYAGSEAMPPDIDVLFVGTVHTDRYAVLSRLAKSLPPGTKTFFFLYFPARFIYKIRRWISPQFWNSKVEEFSFQPLTHAENSAFYKRAKAIVDIERAVQTGLTMRTFEVLAAGKKLITTNKSVASSNLYADANVCVIDRSDPKVPAAFLSKPFEPIDPKVLAQYSLDRWLDDVVG